MHRLSLTPLIRFSKRNLGMNARNISGNRVIIIRVIRCLQEMFRMLNDLSRLCPTETCDTLACERISPRNLKPPSVGETACPPLNKRGLNRPLPLGQRHQILLQPQPVSERVLKVSKHEPVVQPQSFSTQIDTYVLLFVVCTGEGLNEEIPWRNGQNTVAHSSDHFLALEPKRGFSIFRPDIALLTVQ